MNNPIFDFIEEGMPVNWIYQNMGFDSCVICGEDEINEEDVEEYENDPCVWLEKWQIEEEDGWKIAMKFDSENGPIAVMVRPKTEFAKLLFEFGYSEDVKQAIQKDNTIQGDPFDIDIHA